MTTAKIDNNEVLVDCQSVWQFMLAEAQGGVDEEAGQSHFCSLKKFM